MNKTAELYNLTQQVQGQVFYAAVTTHISDEARQAWMERSPLMNLKRGYAESPGWVLVQALEFAPDPLTVKRFRQRAVYSSPSLTNALFEVMASEQLFDRAEDGYHLTEKGQAEADKIQHFRVTTFAGFEPIPLDDITRMNAYLQRVLQASLAVDMPTWCLEHSQRRMPAESAPPLSFLVQYGSDFNALRDDAHMAAYSKYDVDGHIWEAFSYINTNQAQSTSDLYEQLAYRGFYTEDWQAALADLTKRGWVSQTEEIYSVTDKGRTVYEDVEQQTDVYFYSGWDVLSEDEFTDLIHLMTALRDACQALTAQPA